MSRIELQFKIALLILLSFTVGCNVDPFSQLISNKLKDNPTGQIAPAACPQALAVNSTLSLAPKNKVQIGSPAAENLRALGIKGKKLAAGKRLVATYIENCLENKKQKINFEEFILENDRDQEELEEEAQANPCLLKITENFEYHINMLTNDPSIGEQLQFDAINAFEAYDTFYHPTDGISKDIIVAIVDSGVDLDHEDIRANVWKNTLEIPGNNIDDDRNGFVDDVEGWNFAAKTEQVRNNPRPVTWKDFPGGEAHGTHVAGLAGGVWNNSKGGAGIMGSHIKIMAINVFGDSSEGSTAKLNQGIKYAADNHADIINLSLGACGFDRTTRDTILYAICKGSTVITAAGNVFYRNGTQLAGRELSDDMADAENSCEPVTLPSTVKKFFQTPASFGASINGLITVGATDAVPNSTNQNPKSSFSAWSASLVEIGAPGSQKATDGLYSTLPSGTDHPTGDYGREEGTSMSTPVVAGAAALAKSYAAKKGVTLTPMNLERLLETGARTQSVLSTYVKGGKHLDLLKLATEINSNIESYR